MRIGEARSKLVCKAPCLKADDKRLKREPPCNPNCSHCDEFAEDARHLIMHCPYSEDNRINMFNQLAMIDFGESENPCNKSGDMRYALYAREDKSVCSKRNECMFYDNRRQIYIYI